VTDKLDAAPIFPFRGTRGKISPRVNQFLPLALTLMPVAPSNGQLARASADNAKSDVAAVRATGQGSRITTGIALAKTENLQ
jgi:hypothetical protein